MISWNTSWSKEIAPIIFSRTIQQSYYTVRPGRLPTPRNHRTSHSLPDLLLRPQVWWMNQMRFWKPETMTPETYPLVSSNMAGREIPYKMEVFSWENHRFRSMASSQPCLVRPSSRRLEVGLREIHWVVLEKISKVPFSCSWNPFK